MSKKLPKKQNLDIHRISLETCLTRSKKLKRKGKPIVRKDAKHVDVLDIMDLFFTQLDEGFVDTSVSRFNRVQLEAQKKKGRHAYPSEFLEKMESIPTALCNKCKYNKTCPFFIKDKVCFYLCKPFFIDRDVLKCRKQILDRINELIWFGGVFTQEQDYKHLMFVLYLTYFYYRLHEDFKISNHAYQVGKDRQQTELKRAIPNTNYGPKYQVLKRQKELEERWRILGIKPRKDREYYPKI